MRRSSKTCIVSLGLLLALALFFRKNGFSCGPQLSLDEARFSLFRPDGQLSPLEPFYYTEYFLNGYDSDPAENDRQRNVAEWRAFTGRNVPDSAIYAIQYDTDPEAFLSGYFSGKWDSLSANAFVGWLRQPVNRAALDYMALAKRSESLQTQHIDPWGETRLATAQLQKLANDAGAAVMKAKDPFLQQRYAFQAVRGLYYAGKTDTAFLPTAALHIAALYEKYLLGKPTVLAGWAAWFYGRTRPNPLEATRAIVRAFHLSDEKKVIAFQAVSEEDLDAFLKEEKSDTLRLAALAMKGARQLGRALPQLKALAAADPKSKYLPLLAGREVAKLEDWLLSPEVLDFESGMREAAFERKRDYSGTAAYDTTYRYFALLNRQKDRQYLAEVRNYLQSILPQSGPNHAYLSLAVAHLFNIEQRFGEAYQILQALPEPADKALRIQRLVDLAVAEMHLQDVRLAPTQDLLLRRFRALEGLGLRPNSTIFPGNEDGSDSYEPTDDLSELLLLLSRRFQETDDVVRAGLVYNKASVLTNRYDGDGCGDCGPDSARLNRYPAIAYFDRHATPTQIDALLQFRNQKSRSAFDAYIVPEKWADADFYRDLKGTLFVREGRYREALAVFEAMPDSFWVKNYAFKQYLPRTDIKSVGTLVPGGDTNRVYPYESKKLLLRDIVALEEAISRTPPSVKSAPLWLQWGHVQYNISYWGKAWMLFNYGHSSRELDGFTAMQWAWFSGTPLNRAAYYGLSAAMKAYETAVSRSGAQKEVAATALLMLGNCDNTRHFWGPMKQQNLPAGINWSFWGNRDTEPPYLSPYLKRLRRDFRKTELYQAAAVACPDVAGIGKE